MAGIFTSCCGGKAADSGEEAYAPMRTGQTSSKSNAADLEARSRAAEAAEARQQRFDQSPVGKAAKKAINNAKKEREADAAAARRQDHTQDWIN